MKGQVAIIQIGSARHLCQHAVRCPTGHRGVPDVRLRYDTKKPIRHAGRASRSPMRQKLRKFQPSASP